MFYVFAVDLGTRTVSLSENQGSWSVRK